jgi:hypothetical protein
MNWLLHDYSAEQVCDFASLDVAIEIADIFEDIVAEKQ